MPKLQPFQAGPSSVVVAQYLNDAQTHFATDFWMEGRIGAMAGASFAEYVRATLANPSGARPLHTKILGPDVPNAEWSEVMTSAADCGWLDGSGYSYNPDMSAPVNFQFWIAAGCPSVNAQGEWGPAGMPKAAYDWGRLNATQRGPSPLSGKGGQSVPHVKPGKKGK